MGITHKTDGKSADNTMADKFTQRSKDRDGYSEHDPTETVEYQKEQVGDPKFYFVLGLVAITLGIVLVFSRQKMDLDHERELVYNKLAERENIRKYEEEARVRSTPLGPFRDA